MINNKILKIVHIATENLSTLVLASDAEDVFVQHQNWQLV